VGNSHLAQNALFNAQSEVQPTLNFKIIRLARILFELETPNLKHLEGYVVI
jgi:hypothetical protein